MMEQWWAGNLAQTWLLSRTDNFHLLTTISCSLEIRCTLHNSIILRQCLYGHRMHGWVDNMFVAVWYHCHWQYIEIEHQSCCLSLVAWLHDTVPWSHDHRDTDAVWSKQKRHVPAWSRPGPAGEYHQHQTTPCFRSRGWRRTFAKFHRARRRPLYWEHLLEL